MLKRTSMTVDREVRNWIDGTTEFHWRKSYFSAIQLPLDIQRFALNDPSIAEKYLLTPLSRYFIYGKPEWQKLMTAVRQGHRMTSSVSFLHPRISVEVTIHDEKDAEIFHVVVSMGAFGQVARVNEP